MKPEEEIIMMIIMILLVFSLDEAKAISTIMICAGGLMVAFNMDSGHKLVWNSILGIGLALFAAGRWQAYFRQKLRKRLVRRN